LFNQCIRYELYDKLNTINTVMQSSVRQRDLGILTISEIVAIIDGMEIPAIPMMVLVAASTAIPCPNSIAVDYNQSKNTVYSGANQERHTEAQRGRLSRDECFPWL